MSTSSNKMDSAEVYNMFETLKGLIVKQAEKSTEQVNQSVSKEEIEAIIKDYQAKTLSTILNTIDKKVSTLPISQNVSFPQPK